MNNKRERILRNLGVSYLKRILKVNDNPTYVSIFFTRKCNFNCYYCATSKSECEPDISLKQWKNIVNQIYNQGCRYITIYGGEPTLRSDLGELLKHCIDLEMFTHVVTNGTLLNKDLLEEFASFGYFLLGISIDSFKKTNYTPKKYRPELIDLLHDIKERYPESIDYCFHIINTEENIKELIPLIRTINSRLDCRFSIDPVHSSKKSSEQYNYRSYCPELLLKKETMSRLRAVVQNLKKHGIQLMSPNIYYYFMDKWYQNKYFWKCDAGDLYYAIDNDGTVMLCEDVKTPIKFNEFIKLEHKLRVKRLNYYKFDYCDCFKPCYWNPTNFVKNTIKNYIYKFKFR
ncbi:MAG: radical SAM protein [Promethearchaeota archaeon]